MLKRALAGIAEPTLDNPAARLAEPGAGGLPHNGRPSVPIVASVSTKRLLGV